MKHRSKSLLTNSGLAVAAVMTAISCGCSGPGGESHSTATASGVAQRIVKVAEVVPRDYQARLVATGTLAAARHAELRTLVDGDLDQLPVDIGDELRAGDLVFQVRQVDYRLAVQRADAALAEAEAAVAEAEREKSRLENLFREGAATEQMRDRASTAYQLAVATVNRLRAVRDTAAQALADTTAVAPYAAVVTTRFEEQGEFVKQGEPVVEITDLSVLHAELDIPERFVGTVSPGMKVPLTFEADVPGAQATVVAVNPKVDPDSRTFRVKAAVNNTSRTLSAGMFCTATFELPTREGLPAVPALAVQRDEGYSWVWVVEGDRTFNRRIEEIGDADGWVLVRSGLACGETVIVDGFGGLVDGSTVVVESR